MQKGKIGVQMMMLKPQVQEHGIYEVLKKLSQMGFHYVEVSQIDMTPDTITQMNQARAEFGIEISAMSCGMEDLTAEWKYPGDTLKNDFDKIAADCKADAYIRRAAYYIGQLGLARVDLEKMELL